MLTPFLSQRPTRILVLAEQQPTVAVIKLILARCGHETRDVCDASEAMSVVQEWQPHLAVIEVEFAGMLLLQQIGRISGGSMTRIPVLALTLRSDLKTRLMAFDQGVDDIMTLPFSPDELLARVLAIARRSYRQPLPTTSTLRLGDVQIDILNREVRIVGDAYI